MKAIRGWVRAVRRRNSLRRRIARSRGEGRLVEDDGTILCVERTWSTDFSFGLVGWVVGKDGPVRELDLRLDGAPAKVQEWVSRKDVAHHYAQYGAPEHCGFVAQGERSARHEIAAEVRTATGSRSLALTVSGRRPPDPKGFPRGCHLEDFARQVNENRWRVLEVGSREVGNASRRGLFGGASGYVGFDYYAGPNVDVVGDAHRLSDHFAAEEFDAVFSDSVLEHLAMPWRFVMEVNRVLRPGGLIFTSTPSSWPPHERPWDFWRFSDAAYRVLFSRPLGFEVVDIGYHCPMQLVLVDADPKQTELPFVPAFGNVSVLARKISAVSSDLRWDVGLDDVLGLRSAYPEPRD